MTNPDYTHLTLVVDRSGSMASTWADAQGGLDVLLNEQFAQPGKLTLTLVEFDSVAETVVRMGSERPGYQIVPRGMTALLDAVGRGITDTGLDLAALSEDERPGTVVFAVVTDGGENSSKEWTQQALQEKIAEQRDAYGWMFVFIGADEHAWQGANLGMASASFDSSQQDAYLRTYSGLSQSISSSRAAAASGVRQEVSVEDVK